MSRHTKSAANMSSLFGISAGSNADEDDGGTGGALRYQAPKDPSRQRTSSKSQSSQPSQSNLEAPKSASTPNPAPGGSQIIFTTQLRPYVFNQSANQYEAAGGGGLCGCVIVGSGTSYTLLIYDASKTHLCKTLISPGFKITVQPNYYVSFSIESTAYSVNLQSEEQVRRFCKHIMVVSAHAARFLGVAMVDTQLQISSGRDDDSAVVASGDTCGVVYACWNLPTQMEDPPHRNLGGPPVVGNDNDIAKMKAGIASNEPVEGLASMLVGMRLKASRFCIIKSSDPNQPWKFLQFDLLKHKTLKKSKSADPPPSSSPQKFPEPTGVALSSTNSNLEALNTVASPSDKTERYPEEYADSNRPRSNSLADRMARLAAASGGGGIPGISSPTKSPEPTRATSTQSPAPTEDQSPAKQPLSHQTVVPEPSNVPNMSRQEEPALIDSMEASASQEIPVSIAIIPGQEVRSHFANPVPPRSATSKNFAPTHHRDGGDSTWAALILQQQQQSQSSLLNMQGTLMSLVSKIDKIDQELQNKTLQQSLTQAHSHPAPLMHQMQQHPPLNGVPYAYPNVQMLPPGHTPAPNAHPGYLQPGYPQIHPTANMYMSAGNVGANNRGDVDVDQAHEIVGKLITEVKTLRAEQGEGGHKTDELRQKLEKMTEKNSQLMADKMELMQQAHSTLTKGSDTEKRISDLEAKLEAANKKAAAAEAANIDQIEQSRRAQAEVKASHVAIVEELKAEIVASNENIAKAVNEAKEEAAEGMRAAEEKWASDISEARAAADTARVEAAAAQEEAKAAKASSIDIQNSSLAVSEAEAAAKAALDEMKEKLEQEKASSAAFSAAEKEALQKLEAAETDRDAAIARAGKAEAARETLEKELKMATAVEKANMASSASTTSTNVPINPIMEDIYTIMYSSLQLADSEATFTAKKLNKEIRNTLKQIALKYSGSD